MNEGSFWRWLKDRLPPGDYTRIESECSPGIPDVSGVIEETGEDIWIELKASPGGRYPFKQRPGSARERGLRASQRLWITDRVRMGSRVFIAAAIGPGFAIWRTHSALIAEFNGLSKEDLIRRAAYWFPTRRDRAIPKAIADVLSTPF